MPGTYYAPGVYVETLPATGASPIESLATSVLAMIGLYDPKNPDGGTTDPTHDERDGKPKLVTSWAQFTQRYGTLDKALPTGYLGYMHYAMQGYFLNGGKRAYIVGIPVSEKTTAASVTDDINSGIKSLEACEEVTLLACPDVFARAPANPSGTGAGPNKPADPKPALAPLLNDTEIQNIQKRIIAHCSSMRNRFAILDIKQGPSDDAIKWRAQFRDDDNDRYAAMYYPWIGIADGRALLEASQNTADAKTAALNNLLNNGSKPMDKQALQKAFEVGNARPIPIFIPPSGHIAGVFARVDNERGVHKAPANEVVRGVYELQFYLTSDDQAILNPLAVNCIRAFPGQGIRIWGARTLSVDTQWQYVNVQRLFANIGDSIAQNTRWVVFEPNDDILWAAIRRDISAYLTRLWRQGALFGKAPEEAFYVKCDAETNPQEVIDAGYCNIEIGIAPVRPAEFVVLRIGQWQGGSTTTVVGGLITEGV